MLFGLTPTGFTPMTEADVLAFIEADQRADISQTLDLSEQSVLGKTNRIIARLLAEAWTALKAIHDGGDPEQAKADQLTSLMKITGTEREGASPSLVPCTVTLEQGTRLVAGQHFAHRTGKPDSRWTPLEDFTAPSDGSFTLMFRSEGTGPIDAPIGAIAVIATPVVGWAGITSGEVAVGRETDDDDEARERRKDGLQRAGSASAAAIRADVLALDGATSCQVFENWTEATDARGLPPKSFETIVTGVGVSDDAIAQVIWGSRPAGIEPIGARSGTALDSEGNPHVVRFSRTTQVEIWITYQLERLDGYVGDDAFAETVASRLDASLKPGDAVSTWEVATATSGLGVRLRDARFGLAPGPIAKDEIAMGSREVARFDSGRVVLT